MQSPRRAIFGFAWISQSSRGCWIPKRQSEQFLTPVYHLHSELVCYVNSLQSPSWTVLSLWSLFSYIHSRPKNHLGAEDEIASLKLYLSQFFHFLSFSFQIKWPLLSQIKSNTPPKKSKHPFPYKNRAQRSKAFQWL